MMNLWRRSIIATPKATRSANNGQGFCGFLASAEPCSGLHALRTDLSIIGISPALTPIVFLDRQRIAEVGMTPRPLTLAEEGLMIRSQRCRGFCEHAGTCP
jgi:hypothetical protein